MSTASLFPPTRAFAARRLLPLVLLALTACAGVSTHMLGAARPPVEPATVRIYTERPPGAIDIAEIEARSGAGFGTAGQREAALARLRSEAAKLGANGVLLLGRGRDASPVGLSVGGGNYGRHGGVGVGVGIPTTQERVHGVAIWVGEARDLQ
ncbi:hypothetical protein [Arenimonas composti]|nr:hypothetical protein [Arenimonas composti]